MKKYLYLLIPSICLAVFVVFTILVKTIDVSYINGYYLGFSKMNLSFNDWIVSLGWTETLDKISDVFLYVSFLFPFGFLIIGLAQGIYKKSIKAVDKELFVVLGLYVLIVIEYVIFELVKINMSPVKNSPSYPSTHVFVFITVVISGAYLFNKYSVKNQNKKILSLILGVIASLMMVVLRLGSGQHYLTDIIGAVLLSIFLLTTYYFANRLVIEHSN